jgi:hypothetical protein
MREEDDDDVECIFYSNGAFLFKGDMDFVFSFFESSKGHKGKKCLSRSHETHVFWVMSSI